MKWITPGGFKYSFYADLLEQSHLLVAGATGSGKSVIISGLIYTALYSSPENVGFILCDKKMVELVKYAKLPHVIKYADTLPDILAALEYAQALMMRRFAEMKRRGVVESTEKHIYVIVDEFADLMLKNSDREHNSLCRGCESAIQSIAEMGRAAHVHIVLATQAPNRQVIKANVAVNMTAKIALHCESAIESRQIIGTKGAEDLPRYGDCLYKKPGELTHLTNIPMIPAEELAERVKWWTDQTRGALHRLFRRSA